MYDCTYGVFSAFGRKSFAKHCLLLINMSDLCDSITPGRAAGRSDKCLFATRSRSTQAGLIPNVAFVNGLPLTLTF
jgi:hypothetical protein